MEVFIPSYLASHLNIDIPQKTVGRLIILTYFTIFFLKSFSRPSLRKMENSLFPWKTKLVKAHKPVTARPSTLSCHSTSQVSWRLPLSCSYLKGSAQNPLLLYSDVTQFSFPSWPIGLPTPCFPSLERSPFPWPPLVPVWCSAPPVSPVLTGACSHALLLFTHIQPRPFHAPCVCPWSLGSCWNNPALQNPVLPGSPWAAQSPWCVWFAPVNEPVATKVTLSPLEMLSEGWHLTITHHNRNSLWRKLTKLWGLGTDRKETTLASFNIAISSRKQDLVRCWVANYPFFSQANFHYKE